MSPGDFITPENSGGSDLFTPTSQMSPHPATHWADNKTTFWAIIEQAYTYQGFVLFLWQQRKLRGDVKV